MALEGNERLQLREALISAFPVPSGLEQVVSFTFNINSLASIAAGSNYTDVVFTLIRWAETTNRVAALVRGAQNVTPNNALLNAWADQILPRLAARQPPAWYLPTDAFETCFLRGEQPFVDRADLRDHLRNLVNGAGSRVLVVNGPPISGKSYSLEYIAYLAEALGGPFRIAFIDLREESSSAIGPDAVVRSLAHQMSLAVASIPTQAAQAARWVQELRDWIMGGIAQTGSSWCFIFDGFDHADVPEETRQLLKHLMSRAHKLTPALRVILLNYTEQMLPQDIAAFVKRETVGRIGKVEVRGFFDRLITDKVIDADPNVVTQAVDIVMQRLPGNSVDQLASLVAEATRLLRKP